MAIRRKSKHMKRDTWIKRLGAAAAGAIFGLSASSAEPAPETILDREQHPNIVFVLADDFGHGSLNCYGANPDLVRTPHVDRLAEQGVRLTQASAIAAVCSPTRYSLLMGEYPWRAERPVWRGDQTEQGLHYGVLHWDHPLLPDPEQPSIAAMLKENGYNTAMIGKWHLGYGEEPTVPQDWTEPLRPGPLDLGFDYHFGVPVNHGGPPNIYIENDSIYGLRSDRVHPFSRSFYRMPYWGFDAPQRVDEQVTQDLTDKAVDWIRQQDPDDPFFLLFAPVAVHHPITPSHYMRGMSPAGPYADFVQDLDRSVGQIMEIVDYMGFADDTLFIFTSDDGSDIPGDSERPERVAIAQGFDINGPWKGDKHTIWEGGHRIAFIARWPGRIPPGTTSDAMVNMNDVLATFAELVTGEVPEPEVAGRDSFTFLDALLNPNGQHGTNRNTMINSNVSGMMGIRQGPWKYIEGEYPEITPEHLRRPNDQFEVAERQLYNIDEDPREEDNLIEEYPEIAEHLQDVLDAIRESESERRLAPEVISMP